MADNTTQVSEQINSAVNNAIGVGALAAIYTGNFVNFGKEGGAELALITKTITENGTYNAANDGADGYSSVTVAVPSTAGFVITEFTEGETVTATKDDTTIVSDTSGNYVFSLPSSGEWDFTCSDGTSQTVNVTEGSSTSIALLPIRLISSYGLVSYDYELQDSGGYIITVTSNTNAGGVVLNFPNVSKIHCTIVESTAYAQFGCCTSTATLPTIITGGSGRGKYGEVSTDIPFTDYPNFFVGTDNATVKVSISILE